MRDVNFFSVYKGKIEKRENNIKYFYCILVVIFLFTAVNAAVTGVKIFFADKKVQKYTDDFNSPGIQEKLSEANKVNSEIDVLNQYDNKINNVSSSVKNRDNVSIDIFTKLNSKLPEDVNFKSIVVNSNEINIEGTSKSNDAVAEYEHNLKEINDISSVFIESLDKNNSVENEYSFKLNCVLKDVE